MTEYVCRFTCMWISITPKFGSSQPDHLESLFFQTGLRSQCISVKESHSWWANNKPVVYAPHLIIYSKYRQNILRASSGFTSFWPFQNIFQLQEQVQTVACVTSLSKSCRNMTQVDVSTVQPPAPRCFVFPGFIFGFRTLPCLFCGLTQHVEWSME